MLISADPHIEMKGPILFIEGKPIVGKIVRLSDLRHMYPLDLEGAPNAMIYTHVHIGTFDGYDYGMFIIPPKTVGGFYAKTDAYEGRDLSLEFIWGKGYIEVFKENDDGYTDIVLLKINGRGYIPHIASPFVIYNAGSENLIVMYKAKRIKKCDIVKENKGEPLILSVNERKQNHKYLIGRFVEGTVKPPNMGEGFLMDIKAYIKKSFI